MSNHHVPSSQEAIEARRREVEGHIDDHGHSPAAWAGVGICLFGALVGAVGVLIPLLWLFFTGLVVMAAAGPVTLVLSRRHRARQAPSSSGAPSGAVR